MRTFPSALFGLVALAAVFILSVMIVGGRAGARILAVLAACLAAAVLAAWACAQAAWAVAPATLLCSLACLAMIVAGFVPERRLRAAALAGGVLALTVPLLLAALGVWQLKLTGAYNATLRDVWYGPGTRHVPQHFLVAGQIVLTGVGAVADLAIVVTAVMAEVQRVKPHTDRQALVNVGLRLGGDVTGTELNTLIYALLGLHFGAILLPFARPDVRQNVIPWLEVANRQSVAADTLAALAGTAGLLVAIPLTAWIGARILNRKA